MEKFSDYPLVLTSKEVAKIFRVAESTAYAYMKLPGFPSFKMPGTRGNLRVMRDALQAWMMERGETA